MAESDLQKRILDLINDEMEAGMPSPTLEADLENDLGLDSLDRVELCIAIEQEFSLDIFDEETEKWRTPADIVSYVQRFVP